MTVNAVKSLMLREMMKAASISLLVMSVQCIVLFMTFSCDMYLNIRFSEAASTWVVTLL